MTQPLETEIKLEESALPPGAQPVIGAERARSIDVLRGLVMVIMALDHVRDYFSNAQSAPLNLSSTTPALFFTRWITHFCAPIFILLAGISAYLWAARGRSRRELAQFLLTRGIFLIVLEFTLIRFAWFFTLDYEISMAQVIWAIGWSMIALAGLVFLPRWAILVFATVMIGGHNLLDRLPAEGVEAIGWLWTILHQPEMVEVLPGHQVYMLYPLLPWVGVMALGYWLGPLFERPQAERRMKLLVMGIVCIVLFIVLRATNLYGDPQPWSPQRDPLFTLLSFVNVEKYPPSLLFLLMTLGPAALMLAMLDSVQGRGTQPFEVYGRVPFFFYVAHLYLIHLLAVGLAWLRHGSASWLFGTQWMFHMNFPPDYGYDLPVLYLIWAAVVIALYPACHWFMRFKQKHRLRWWISYL